MSTSKPEKELYNTPKVASSLQKRTAQECENHLLWFSLLRAFGWGEQKVRTLLSLQSNSQYWLNISQEQWKEHSLPPSWWKILEQWRTSSLHIHHSDEALCADESIHIYTINDLEYPALLKQCPWAPPFLFVKGKLSESNSLGVVGTRQPDDYGYNASRKLLYELSPYQIQVISGMAEGLDRIAHRAALDYNIPTTAVTGAGLLARFSKQEKEWHDVILQNDGAIVSQFLGDTPAAKTTFPRRNEVISGMSSALLLLQSKIRGGSMITAQKTIEIARPIFALPGPIHSILHQGPHHLLWSQQARPALNGQEIATDMGWLHKPVEKIGDTMPQKKQRKQRKKMNIEENLMEHLEKGPADLEQILEICQEQDSLFSPAQGLAILSKMEIKGQIHKLPNGRWGL